ncbi:Nif3-like dinuclear metal center hexameric protein [Irregularibacter muris]|uniref:Nif3-like dinuclear metal center hexameric protein n=1 Tax=Irregularibacter muris TaxID=1796619 RepID=A0AAE3HEA1_9FIRM|nr:Nif3-like dinuclear metal center hexameric protein [Irregularibacter muris]MCR1898887.1 Nif3-like dinuclear metal center hexameric protein [Irregularibacter muris]
MNTRDIMQLALDMAGFDDIPADSEIYVEGGEIKKILFGVDIDSSDLYYAKENGYDAVIAHHPQGSIINAYEVYQDHIKVMKQFGVPEEVARNTIEEKYGILKISVQSSNYENTISVAKMLDMPFLNIHQPLDEIGRRLMQQRVDEVCSNGNATLMEVVKALSSFKEMQIARTNVELLIGEEKDRAGKTVIAHGTYTNGGYDVANTYFENGIDTVVYIHIAYADYVKLKKEKKGNLIVSGHIASDSLGINPFVKALREKGLEVTTIKGILE